MKKKNLLPTFLISTFTVFAVLGYHAVSKNNPFNNLKAENDYYEINLTSFPNFNPTDEYSGTFTSENLEIFYLSHQEAIQQFSLSLNAKDDKTPGVILNTRVINGLLSIKVAFSGGPLYAIATTSFFERYETTIADELVSDEVKEFTGDDLGYFLLLSPSVEGVLIQEITIRYHCVNEVDQYFVHAPGLNYFTGARSWGEERLLTHDYLSFKTNPTPITNNYSSDDVTTEPNKDRVDSWFRWNGLSLRNYGLDGEGEKDYSLTPKGEFKSNSFEVITSVFIEPRVFYDEEAWFNVAPWICLTDEEHSNDHVYLQSYIGNDNFDPLGGIKTNRNDTYRGRFYTSYAAGGGGHEYGFVNPDIATVINDPTMTLREAYEVINLPFFNVRFVIKNNNYEIYINNLKIVSEENFYYDSETYVDEKFTLDNIALQGVNYGLKDGTPGDETSLYDPYYLTFMNPIIREIV